LIGRSKYKSSLEELKYEKELWRLDADELGLLLEGF
jgi:hypothetical protein